MVKSIAIENSTSSVVSFQQRIDAEMMDISKEVHLQGNQIVEIEGRLAEQREQLSKLDREIRTVTKTVHRDRSFIYALSIGTLLGIVAGFLSPSERGETFRHVDRGFAIKAVVVSFPTKFSATYALLAIMAGCAVIIRNRISNTKDDKVHSENSTWPRKAIIVMGLGTAWYIYRKLSPCLLYKIISTLKIYDRTFRFSRL